MKTANSLFHITTKPIGPICNLDCTYCFYLKKEALYPEHERASDFRMPLQTLDTYIREYIEAQPGSEVQFAWQGGEPTMLGLDYFKHVVELQDRYCPPDKRVSNAIQTNGILLSEEWCKFLARNHFLVGLSIDGPKEFHDMYRVAKGGEPTFDRVFNAMMLLKKHSVEFNTLTVIHRELACHPVEVYEFLRENGSGFMQFIPLVERVVKPDKKNGGNNRLEILRAGWEVSPWSVEPLQFGLFLSDIFDGWIRRDVGKIFVQTFDVQLGIWVGYGSTLCIFGETCGRALAIEHNGDLYACDHFVSPEFKIGNINSTPLHAMVESQQQHKFGDDKRDSLPAYCKSCEVRFACNGECPKNRFSVTSDGEAGLNYLCAGYKHFLNHIRPYMQTMAGLLHQQKPPADIMRMLAIQKGSQPMPRTQDFVK